MPNHFFNWPLGAPRADPIDPAEFVRAARPSDSTYFYRCLSAVDAATPHANLTFLVTWNLDRFDDRFDGAVVLLIGDEMYQVPSYAPRVKAIFKTGGLRPNPLGATVRLPWSIAWRSMLRDARNAAVRLRRRMRHGGGGRRGTPIFELPLGTFRLVDVPFIPVQERTTDVFFAGTAPAPGGVNLRPSVAARRQMTDGIVAAERALPRWRFEHTLTQRAGDVVAFGPEEYSRRMMNAKVVPCPRGNFDETFRLFEAAKSGCVIVTEPLPDRWYYRDAPVIELHAWRQLPSVLAELDRHPNRVHELSERTRRWWDETLSEAAVGRYICNSLPEARRPTRAAVSAGR